METYVLIKPVSCS